MSNDTIKRSDAIKATWQEPTYTDPLNVLTEVRDRIEAIPSADRPQGVWSIDGVDEIELSYGGMAYEPVYKCSYCGRVTESYVRFDEPIMPKDADFPNYCGWCGCRMKGADDE